MNTNRFRLELLPNETFIDIFEYIDAKDLFRAFYNLNTRFNKLLQSSVNLSIKLETFVYREPDNIRTFSQYIHNVILDTNADMNLSDFSNIRRLKLLGSTRKQLEQLTSINHPHLEYLTIGDRYIYIPSSCSCYMLNDCDPTFCDYCSYTKCKSYFDLDIGCSIGPVYGQMPPQHIKVKEMSFIIYQGILSACPNLRFLQFSIRDLNEKSVVLKPHFNLKQMVINFDEHIKQLDDCNIDSYLLCVPNLEQLDVYRVNRDADLKQYLNYNWLATSIGGSLLLLRRFKFHFQVYSAGELLEYDSENILHHLEENFRDVHNNRYTSKLVFKLFRSSV